MEGLRGDQEDAGIWIASDNQSGSQLGGGPGTGRYLLAVLQ